MKCFRRFTCEKKWKFERIKAIVAHCLLSNCSSCVIYFEQQIEEIRRDNHFRLRLRIKVSLLYSPRGFATPLPQYTYWWSLELRRLHSLFDGSPHSKGEKLIEDFLKRKRIYENLLESTKVVWLVLESNVPSGKTNLPSPPSIDNPRSVVGVWRPNVIDNSAVFIRVTSSSATFTANTASAIMLMIPMESFTRLLP